MARAARPPRNLGNYWKMEAANVLFVPALALWFGFPRDNLEAVAIGLAVVAAAGFLLIGAMFWRGIDRRLRLRDRDAEGRALKLADSAEKPLLAIGAAAVGATIVALTVNGLTPAVIAALALSLLAGLEYVNYYHRQLQHFDNRADFKRLVTGRGGKPSHMARDLAAWRRARAD